MKARHLVLAVALAAALLIRLVDPWKHTAQSVVAEAPHHFGSALLTHTNDSGGSLATAQWHPRMAANEEPVDPFAPPKPVEVPAPAVTVAVPAPPPPAPARPPSAPPLPYTAIGDWSEQNATIAFLAGPNGLVAARSGDTLGGVYHVDMVTRGHAVLTYMPLQEAQQLTWSSNR